MNEVLRSDVSAFTFLSVLASILSQGASGVAKGQRKRLVMHPVCATSRAWKTQHQAYRYKPTDHPRLEQ